MHVLLHILIIFIFILPIGGKKNNKQQKKENLEKLNQQKKRKENIVHVLFCMYVCMCPCVLAISEIICSTIGQPF